MKSKKNNKNHDHEKLPASDKRLKSPRGSYEAQRWLAAEEADSLKQEANEHPRPDIFLLYNYSAQSFKYAVEIAMMTHTPKETPPEQFVGNQVRLFEYMKRVEDYPNIFSLLENWSKNPGITFAWLAGRSALEVAIQFAKMIYTATATARKEIASRGATSYDSLLVAPKPDSEFDKWRDRTIEELLTHQIPNPDIWPSMADIHRDYRSLQYKMEDEYSRFVAPLDKGIVIDTIKQPQKSRNLADNKKFIEREIMEYDVFICHASEDKKDFVKPLANALAKQNLKVWYDEFELTLGDSLREKIDYGLANSRYGVVVLSKAFFEKKWTKEELDGLAARQTSEGKKVILPIWYKVGCEDVKKFSPMLAGKLAARSEEGLGVIVSKILATFKEEPPLKRKSVFQTTNQVSLLAPQIKKKLIIDLKVIKNNYSHLDMKIFLDTESGSANRRHVETELLGILADAGFAVHGSGNSTIIRGQQIPPVEILVNPNNLKFAEQLSEVLNQFINVEFPLSKSDGFPKDALKIFIRGDPLFSPDGVVSFQ